MSSKKYRKKIENTAARKKDEPVPNGAQLTRKIIYQQQLTRTRQSILNWRRALNSAENIQYPQRIELLRLFQDTVLDAMVEACFTNRTNSVLGSRFIVKKKKRVNGLVKYIIDEEKTNFIDAGWFRSFIKFSMESIYWGHSLIQFGDYIASLEEFKDLQIIRRECTKPEFDLFVEEPYAIEGINYNDESLKKWVVPIGGKRDLGLLSKLAPLVLWKKGAIESWSIFTESFGVPVRVLQTDKTDAQTRAEFEDMLTNLNSSAWGIIGKDDILTMHEIKNRDSYSVFQNLIDAVDRQIALIVLGQTSLTDEKSFVGAAEIQERAFKQMNLVDKYFIEDVLKNKLVPLLNLHGFGFENFKICVEPDDAFTLQQKAKFEIELLKTKLYTLPAEYIMETYGSPVIIRNTSEDSDKTKADDIEKDIEQGEQEREDESREKGDMVL